MLLTKAKTTMLVILLTMIAGITGAQSAPEKLQMAVFPAKEPLKLWVIIAKPNTNKTARLELIDAHQRRLYATGLSRKKQQVMQLFNLKDINDGQYTLRVVTETDVVEKSFSIKTPDAQIAQRSLYFVPSPAVASR